MNSVHTVQKGESAASIAQMYTNDPSREIELLHANMHKPLANAAGHPVFASLHAGEPLNLPAHWNPQYTRIAGLAPSARAMGIAGAWAGGGIPGTWTRTPGLQGVGLAPPAHLTSVAMLTGPVVAALGRCYGAWTVGQQGMWGSGIHSVGVQQLAFSQLPAGIQAMLNGALNPAGPAQQSYMSGAQFKVQVWQNVTTTVVAVQPAGSALGQNVLYFGCKQQVPPHYARLSSLISQTRTGLGDASSVQNSLGALQNTLNIGIYVDPDGSYATCINGMQTAGNNAATTLGPDIDSTYGIANTGTYTQNAWGINGSLAAVNNGDANSSTPSAASDAGQAQGLLAQMLSSYQGAIAAGQAAQGGGGGGTTPTQPSNVVTAAQNAADAMSASNACATVGQGGSAANSAVHSFKLAWNAANPSGQLAFNGQFDAATAGAISEALGSTSTPSACGATPPPPPPPGPKQTVTCPGDPTAHPAGYVCPPVPPPPVPVGNLVKCPDGTMVNAGTACPAATMNWLPWVIGGVAVAAGIGLVVYANRKPASVPTPAPAALPHTGTENGYESSRHVYY